MRSCRICSCTDADCSWCIVLNDRPCFWVDPDLCSACFFEPDLDDHLRASLRYAVAADMAKRRNAPGARELMRHAITCRRVADRLEAAAK